MFQIKKIKVKYAHGVKHTTGDQKPFRNIATVTVHNSPLRRFSISFEVKIKEL